jgi:serine/threonine-protein kinase
VSDPDDRTMDAASVAPSTAGTVPRATSAPGVGDRFAGRYLVDAVLGRGGMGTVLRVRDELLGGEPVALKLLDHTSAAALERFRREVLLARRITSPHVARTHDLGAHEGLSYLTMELVVGRSLGAELASEGALAPARAARIGAAVARGLAAAHEAGVVHRDLKPDNVLVGDDGRIVVTDFGIARALSTPEDARLTAGIAGTPHYMAPEQVTGRDVGPRADLFSLGVLLFECLTGELPYAGDTPLAAAIARVQGAPRDITAVRALPPALAALVMQLLASDPAARPPGALEVAARLDAIVSSLTDASAPEGAAPTPARAGAPTPGASGTPATTRAPTTGGSVEQLLAIMPFEHRGAPRDASVAESVRDELIDLVARTRGLSTLARSATGDAATARAQGATQLVEASVQTGSGKLRATVRLLDPASGRQLWTERIEGDYADPFAGPERTAQRIVEHLRLALETVAVPSRVPPQAIDAFKEARKRLRSLAGRDPAEVVVLLERAIEAAPSFAPALALHAIACVRAWFSPATGLPRDWAAEVRASIARALERAPHVAESHHAAALVAWHEGRLRDAAAQARAALAIAPSYPDAMAFVGQLEVEAGRDAEGLERVRVSHELEPSLRIGVIEPARWHGLYGDLDEYERLIGVIERDLRDPGTAAQSLVRVGAWRGRRDLVERGLALLARETGPAAAAITTYGRVALDPTSPALMPDPALFARTSPRFATLAFQILAEVSVLAGRPDDALTAIQRAADAALADLAWLDRCPLFDTLRDRPEFRASREQVRQRVDDIWV